MTWASNCISEKVSHLSRLIMRESSSFSWFSYIVIVLYVDCNFFLTCFCVSGVCWFSSATRSDRNLYAWQDSYAEDFPDPNLPCSLVAESPRECGDGLVSGKTEERRENAKRQKRKK